MRLSKALKSNAFSLCPLCCRLQYMDRGGFEEAVESLDSLIAEYEELGQPGRTTEQRGSNAPLRPAF